MGIGGGTSKHFGVHVTAAQTPSKHRSLVATTNPSQKLRLIQPSLVVTFWGSRTGWLEERRKVWYKSPVLSIMVIWP